ncbi:alanine racemase [Candidatus Uhrbacteria bacterium]|nr:alanine racemase [Candidatus Uhrbacteria bacterium]
MRSIFRKLRRSRFSYKPLVEVFIYASALRHNYSFFQNRKQGLSVAPVLKSNAYGHGLVNVAQVVDTLSAPFLAVDSYFEALVLRNEGIRSPLLVIGYTPQENIERSRLKKIFFTIVSLDELEVLSRTLSVSRTFHLKVDTGMRRQGIGCADISKAALLVKKNPNIILDGLCSHFADADGQSTVFTREQIQKWNEAVRFFRKEFPALSYYHISQTAGVEYAQECDANVLRLGLGLYGMTTNPREDDQLLRPALEMRSILATLRQISSGEKVGYNITFQAERNMKIATVPVGYYEGIDRRLSSKGSFMIGDTPCPIVGRVSMNITSIDVSAVSSAKLGMPVTIISSQKKDANSVEQFAVLCGAIPYELLVRIPSQLRRTLV